MGKRRGISLKVIISLPLADMGMLWLARLLESEEGSLAPRYDRLGLGVSFI